MSLEPGTTAAATKAAQTGLRGATAVLRAGAHTKRNDRLARRVYEDLKEWARSERDEQAQRLGEVDRDTDDRWLYTALHLRRQADIRSKSAERWRRRKVAAKRKLEDIEDTENVVHAVVRRIRGRPWPPRNPFEREIEELVRNWEHSIKPRSVPVPPAEFQKLVEQAPGLGRAYAEAAAITDPGDTLWFCANRIWYAQFKPRIEQLVGWGSSNPALQTMEAYDLGYETVYEALPHCRDCGEPIMPAGFFDDG